MIDYEDPKAQNWLRLFAQKDADPNDAFTFGPGDGGTPPQPPAPDPASYGAPEAPPTPAPAPGPPPAATQLPPLADLIDGKARQTSGGQPPPANEPLPYDPSTEGATPSSSDRAQTGEEVIPPTVPMAPGSPYDQPLTADQYHAADEAGPSRLADLAKGVARVGGEYVTHVGTETVGQQRGADIPVVGGLDRGLGYVNRAVSGVLPAAFGGAAEVVDAALPSAIRGENMHVPDDVPVIGGVRPADVIAGVLPVGKVGEVLGGTMGVARSAGMGAAYPAARETVVGAPVAKALDLLKAAGAQIGPAVQTGVADALDTANVAVRGVGRLADEQLAAEGPVRAVSDIGRRAEATGAIDAGGALEPAYRQAVRETTPAIAGGATNEAVRVAEGTADANIPRMGYTNAGDEAAGLLSHQAESTRQTPISRAEVAQRAEDVFGLAPGTLRRVQEAAIAQDPAAPAVAGQMMRTAAHADAEAAVSAYDALQNAARAVSGRDVDSLSAHEKLTAAEAAFNAASQALMFSAKATTAEGSATARALAQRQHRVIAEQAYETAQRVKAAGDAAHAGGKAIDDAVAAGTIGPRQLQQLQRTADQLDGAGNLLGDVNGASAKLDAVEQAAQQARDIRRGGGRNGSAPSAATASQAVPVAAPATRDTAERLASAVASPRQTGSFSDFVAQIDAISPPVAVAVKGAIAAGVPEGETERIIANALSGAAAGGTAQAVNDRANNRVSDPGDVLRAAVLGAVGGVVYSKLRPGRISVGQSVEQVGGDAAHLLPSERQAILDASAAAQRGRPRVAGLDPDAAIKAQMAGDQAGVNAGVAASEAAYTGALGAEKQAQLSYERFMNGVQARLDTAGADQARARTAADVSALGREARSLIENIKANPSDEALRTRFDDVMGAMHDYSLVGAKAAQDIRGTLNRELDRQVNSLSKGAETRNEQAAMAANQKAQAEYDRLMGGVERRNQQAAEKQTRGLISVGNQGQDAVNRASDTAIDQSRIRGVTDQIRQVLQHPEAPGAMDQLAALRADLTEIGQAGFERSSQIRERLFKKGLMRAGLASAAEDVAPLIRALSKVDVNDPASMKAIVATLGQNRPIDRIMEYQFINMLSSPMTQAVNATSNGLQIAGRLLLNNPLEMVYDAARTGGKNVNAKDVAAAFTGAAKGLKTGAAEAGQVLRTGTGQTGMERAVETGDLSRLGREFLTEKYGPIGTVLHTVTTRPLEAADAFFGHIAYASAVEQEASRASRQIAKQTGEDANQIMQRILDNPWDHPEIIDKAGAIRDYTLLRTRGTDVASRALNQLAALRNAPPEADFGRQMTALLANQALPFYRVPMNATIQGIDRSAGAIYNPIRLGMQIAKGDNTAREAELFAKSAIGIGTMGLAGSLAASDNLTGAGPVDRNDPWYRTHVENAWRVPGTQTWFTWQGTPWAVPFATVAGAKKGYEDAQKKNAKALDSTPGGAVAAGAVGAVKGAGAGIVSQSFLDNLQQYYKGVTGADSTAPAVAAGTVRRFLPLSSGMNFFARVGDDVQRDVKAQTDPVFGTTIPARVEQGIPFARQTLPPQIGQLGENVPNEQSGVAGAVPFYRGRGAGGGNPIYQELERYGAHIPPAPQTMTIPGAKEGPFQLRMSEQREYQKIAGPLIREALTTIIADPDYQKADGSTRTKWLERSIEKARTAAEPRVREFIGEEEIRRRLGRAPAGVR